jgi:phosphocarrier protein FPr
MVGLVIVSHSAALAEGVTELARQMAGPDVPIVPAGGLEDGAIGTDVARILAGLERADQGDGVLVLMDLGSAILSAEMAREMLDPDSQSRIQLCEAPLVEGALAAAVQAKLGASLAQVADEARGALGPKQEHLGPAPEAQRPALANGTAAPHGSELLATLELLVNNALGLHARPAARLVQAVAASPGRVQVLNVTTGKGPVNAKSINAVTTLGVRGGHTIRISVDGADAAPVFAALRVLAAENWGDDPSDQGPERPEARTTGGSGARDAGLSDARDARALRGTPASPGIGIGPARPLQAPHVEAPADLARDREAEQQRLRAALTATQQRIEEARTAVLARGDRHSAEIFDAHLLFLSDEALSEPALAAIGAHGRNAAAAWASATQAMADQYRRLDDSYLQARAADVEDVGRQVVAELLGIDPRPTMSGPGVLIAHDLSPAETAVLDPACVVAIVTAVGGPTSHTAILARSLGIPAVVGLGPAVLDLAEGSELIVDGTQGVVLPAPEAATRAEYANRQADAARVAAALRAAAAEPAVTADGRRVEVVANIGSVKDAERAVAAGAEGVGLFRTEFLFLDRATAPSEDEQYAAYRAVCAAMQGRPVIVRTLDVGGDKPLAYIDMGHEENPFLGWRAVRFGLDNPAFFKIQLRAIARVAAEFPLKVMFPMIAVPSEYLTARELLRQAASDAGVSPAIETGIMVEIPSAALRARPFAELVDFFSIGTNDLTQYTLAAERGNPRVARLADAFQPAVLDLIRQTAEAAQAAGKWAGVCGELAGDPLAVEVLIGLGITELSMSAPAIAGAKHLVRTTTLAQARAKAQHALSLSDANAVRAFLSA